MDLFSQAIEQPDNLLPKDGDVRYYGTLLPLEQADHYYSRLLESIDWKNDTALIYGKRIITKRKVAWYGDKPFEYTYSHSTKQALPWTDELRELKAWIEDKSGETYNSCLLNLYHNGSEGMAWHRDEERDLKQNGAIGSISLGADRKFSFRHLQTKEQTSLILEHGSLLVMKGSTQSNWQHSLHTQKAISEGRINLTFRSIVQDE